MTPEDAITPEPTRYGRLSILEQMFQDPAPEFNHATNVAVGHLARLKATSDALNCKADTFLDFAQQVIQRIHDIVHDSTPDHRSSLALCYELLISADRFLVELYDGEDDLEEYNRKTDRLIAAHPNFPARDLIGRPALDVDRMVKFAQETITDRVRDVVNKISLPALQALKLIDLPTEIIRQVFDLLQDLPTDWTSASYSHTILPPWDCQDVANLRLTHSYFRDIGAEFMFPHVEVEMTESSLQRLENIASSTTLARGVRIVRVALNYYGSGLASDIGKFASYQFDVLYHELTELEEGRSVNPLVDAEPLYESPEARSQSIDICNALLDVFEDVMGQPTENPISLHCAFAQITSAHYQYQDHYSQQES